MYNDKHKRICMYKYIYYCILLKQEMHKIRKNKEII